MGGVIAVSALVAAGLALAFVPDAERIARAIATANQASSRDQALQLDLTLRVADREPIGTGKLIIHPHGLARLELRDAAGRTERHLRVVRDHAAARNGEELERPRAFLPPLSFLQVDSSNTLQQALTDYGLDAAAAGIAPCGKSICFVVGDPTRAAPTSPPPAEHDEQKTDAAEGGAAEPVDPEPAREQEDGTRRPRASIWVDTRSFDIIRMESPSGVIVDFGPVVDFKGVRFPDSITIAEPEREPVRFDILGVTAVNAPAAGFTRSWLLTPADPTAPSETEPPSAPAGR